MTSARASASTAQAAALSRRALLTRAAPLVAGGALLSLAGCGFHLRGAPDFAFQSIYANIVPTSALGVELKRNLAALGKVRLITDVAQQKEAQVILDVMQEAREKVVVGVNASGQVREFQLRLRFRFRLRTPQGKELIASTELLQQRDISFSESAVLAKETEESLLYRDMQTDIVQQLMRRLAAVKEI